MARLSTLAALLAALLFIAQATAELTIVTTDVEDDTENRRQDDRDCRQQLQEQQYLNDCQRYLRQQSQQSEGFDTSSEREQRQQCCRQLKQLSRNCRCDGLNEMLRQLRGQLQGQELREMMQIAQNLPNECNMKPRSWRFEDTTTFCDKRQKELCCHQLRQMDRDCRCEGLNEMMRQQRGQFQGQELIREMMQMAENLPNECNLSPQRCDIEMRRSRWF
ncbi:2S seed storage albumin protein-like [Quercus robur]|uniref:2S seed storage albumin protein-like n=1 Tax=Quercus robur TaxID=38942 RepID=UPI0021629193|nr:2S seed storage albumin protein-like [Quercus robur]